MIIFIGSLYEIKIKLRDTQQITRRLKSNHAKDIGSWRSILSFIALIAIPINIYVLMLLGNMDEELE